MADTLQKSSFLLLCVSKTRISINGGSAAGVCSDPDIFGPEGGGFSKLLPLAVASRMPFIYVSKRASLMRFNGVKKKVAKREIKILINYPNDHIRILQTAFPPAILTFFTCLF